MMTATLRAVGGSFTLTLPKALLGLVDLTVGHKLQIEVQRGKVVLTPLLPPAGPQYKLADLLKDCDFSKPTRRLKSERDWLDAPSVGRGL